MNFARENFAREIFNFLFTFYTICAIIGIDNIRKFVDFINMAAGGEPPLAIGGGEPPLAIGANIVSC